MSAYTDELVNKLTPDEQISSLLTYEDQVSEAEKALVSEKVGLSLATDVTGATTAAGANFVDSTYAAFTMGDAHRWLYVTGTTGAVDDGWHYIEEFVDANTVKTSTTFTATDTGLSWTLYREPNLQDDINIAITQLREIIDPANDWFQNMPRGFNPCDTDVADVKNEKMSLKTIADNWYGSKTKIIDVLTTSQAVSASDTGILFATSLQYATNAVRQGLVIQNSDGNTYPDEVALASITIGKHKVTLVDALTQAEFFDASGNLIYGVLQDAADEVGGTGDGTDVFIKFVYDNAGTPTAYTWTAGDPANIIAYMPQRKCARNLLEYDERVLKTAGIVGDAELSEDIEEIRDGLGLADGEGAGDWDITNLTDSYVLAGLATAGTLNASVTMEDIVNELNDEIGDRLYTEDNFVTDGETITESIDALDQALKSAGIKCKLIQRVTTSIIRGTVTNVPFGGGAGINEYNPDTITTYKLDTNYVGLYMDIYVGGKKLVPDSAAATQDGEYEETSTTTWTPRFTIAAGQIIEYVVKSAA